MEGIKNIFQFGGSLLLLTVLLVGGVYVIQHFTGWSLLSAQYLVLTLFIYMLTVFAYTISIVGIRRNPEMGVYGILGGITVKMIVSLSFFIFLLYRFPSENKMLLGLNFFCIYFLMSCFEVIVLLRNLRRKIK